MEETKTLVLATAVLFISLSVAIRFLQPIAPLAKPFVRSIRHLARLLFRLIRTVWRLLRGLITYLFGKRPRRVRRLPFVTSRRVD